MRGDGFIHFVSGSRRVNIRLGVLLLIPKSPQTQRTVKTGTSIYQRLDRPQLTRIKHLAASPRLDLRQLPSSSCAHLQLDHASHRHHPSSLRPHTTVTDFTYTSVNLAINRHFCCICYFAFCSLHCLWLSLLTCIKLKSFAGSTRLSAPQQLFLLEKMSPKTYLH